VGRGDRAERAGELSEVLVAVGRGSVSVHEQTKGWGFAIVLRDRCYESIMQAVQLTNHGAPSVVEYGAVLDSECS